MSDESKKDEKPEKASLVERTDSRGLVRVKIPWLAGHFEFEFPGTNRSVMIIVCAMFCMLTFIIPTCCYIIFVGAPVENIQEFGNLISTRDQTEARKPEQVPVQTEDGIEIVELCPPCPECAENLEECPSCPICSPQLPCFYPESVPDAGDSGL